MKTKVAVMVLVNVAASMGVVMEPERQNVTSVEMLPLGAVITACAYSVRSAGRRGNHVDETRIHAAYISFIRSRKSARQGQLCAAQEIHVL